MDTGRNTQGIARDPFQGRAWRELAQLAGEAIVAGLLISLVLALAIFIATTQAQAAEPARTAGARTSAQGAVLHREGSGTASAIAGEV